MTINSIIDSMQIQFLDTASDRKLGGGKALKQA